MGTAIRQRKLFAAEDFRVIFRAFTEINFSAFDFDTLRSAMIDYIRLNFPEDFNDWIESSEFVSLIELLAYLGQSLAFRMDLNTRENFLTTAERKESILKLARLISFNPSRNFPATGLVKITEISTNQPIIDSNGNNLSNLTIVWNDPINPDWFEQFILIMNSIFSSTNPFGSPQKEGLVGGIKTQLYELNNDSSANRVFPFSSNISGENINFEIINPDFIENEVFFEREPDPLDPLHIIFRNDGTGNDSPDTGFFLMFKQGTLKKEDFQIDVPIENRVIDLEATSVNNIDVFVHEINEEGLIIKKWEKVPSVVGNNIIFNSLDSNKRNIFEVITRPNDQISIKFSDGRFGNVPTGLFRVWIRESNGRRYQIQPEDMKDNRLDIPYLDKVNNTLFFSSFNFSLQRAISNSAPSETSSQIRNRAPQVFFTQDRMVNGEDYNVFPLRNPEAAKVKAVNRIHSGFSRHIDINDPTGFSQNVNLFGEDGILYLEENDFLEELALPTSLSDTEILNKIILPLIQKLEKKHLFYFKYPRFTPTILPLSSPVSIIIGDAAPTNLTNPGTFEIEINGTIISINVLAGDTVLDVSNNINTALGLASITNIISSVDTGRLKIEDTTQGSFILRNSIGSPLNELGIIPNPVTIIPRIYGTFWKKATEAINSSSGRLFIDSNTVTVGQESPIIIGNSVIGTNEFFIQEGSLLRFKNAGLVSVISVIGDGNTILSNGDGAILLSENVDDYDVIEEIIPPFRTQFSDLETNQILSQITQKNTFGIRYDKDLLVWKIITGDNLASTDVPFDFTTAGDVTGLNKDSTWLLRAEFNTTNWRFISRGLDYIFESDKQIRFFNIDNQRLVDPQTGKVIEDFIKILKINSSFDAIETSTTVDFFETNPVTSLNKDFVWNIENIFIEKDGFIDPRRIKLTFTDLDLDGVPDDPFIFETITKINSSNINLELPDEIVDETELFWESIINSDGFQELQPTQKVKKAFNSSSSLNFPGIDGDSNAIALSIGLSIGDVYYNRDDGKFYLVDISNIKEVTELYTIKRGRNNFLFQWKHFASPDRRIDPAITNIIDMFVLTTSYDTAIRKWIDEDGALIDKPSPPTSEDLRILFSEEIKNKMISDEIIFHPVQYKLLFGSQADEKLQGRFKITKIPGTEKSDGEIKSEVIRAINEFFAITNWDFGETFYYTELAAFIHQKLATFIASIVLVPLDNESKFGNLFQVRSESNEVFISSAKVSDIQIVSSFSDNILRIGK